MKNVRMGFILVNCFFLFIKAVVQFQSVLSPLLCIKLLQISLEMFVIFFIKKTE